jgi:hypothetical protein
VGNLHVKERNQCDTLLGTLPTPSPMSLFLTGVTHVVPDQVRERNLDSDVLLRPPLPLLHLFCCLSLCHCSSLCPSSPSSPSPHLPVPLAVPG